MWPESSTTEQPSQSSENCIQNHRSNNGIKDKFQTIHDNKKDTRNDIPKAMEVHQKVSLKIPQTVTFHFKMVGIPKKMMHMNKIWKFSKLR